MLTSDHKQKRIEWAKKHINDNWNKTLFSDETSFQLFRNTIKQWYKGARPIRPIPKDRRKRGGFCVKDETSLFSYRHIMDPTYSTQILDLHLPTVSYILNSI